MKFLSKEYSPRWDPAASHLGLCCLPMSHEKDARLIQVNYVLPLSKSVTDLTAHVWGVMYLKKK